MLSASIKTGRLLKPGKSKRVFYNYLIIDAKKFFSLMSRRSGLNLGEDEPNFNDFELFKLCILYIGKGTNSRRDAHLKSAKNAFVNNKHFANGNGLASCICKCWMDNGGIFSIQLEAEANGYEAHCREAAIISVLGLENLKNKINGTMYGEMRDWPSVKVKNYGEMLLYTAFKSFTLKRPPVIRAEDVQISSKSRRSTSCVNCGHIT